MKNKQTLNILNQNQIRLSILQKQVVNRYKEYLNSIRTSRKESEFKLNPDFFKIQEKLKEEIESKQNEEKPIFITKKIEQLKDVSSKIKDKVTDFQNTKVFKDEQFKNLEQEIAHLETMIEHFQIENRILKQQLELLIEQEQKGSIKSKLEKENISLKEKIETFQNKDKTPFKVNKITYAHSQERER